MEFVDTVLRATPHLGISALVAVAVGVALAPLVARFLGTSAWRAVIPVLALAAVVVLTLTPSLDGGQSAAARFCGTQPAWPMSPVQWASLSQRSLNVALFVPLGASVIVARGRRRAALTALVLVVPGLVEAAQYAFPVLGRSCSATDIVDNLTGAVLGMVASVGTDLLIRQARHGRRRADADHESGLSSARPSC